MANPELGTKQVCPNCQTKFYDLGRRPAVCPKCATAFDPEEAVRNRRARPRATPDYESDEDVKPVAPKAEGEEFEEADDVPEIDDTAAAEADPVEDAEEAPAVVEPDVGVDFEEPEELEEAEVEDVPFLEEEEEENFGDEDLEHRPGHDDT